MNISYDPNEAHLYHVKHLIEEWEDGLITKEQYQYRLKELVAILNFELEALEE